MVETTPEDWLLTKFLSPQQVESSNENVALVEGSIVSGMVISVAPEGGTPFKQPSGPHSSKIFGDTRDPNKSIHFYSLFLGTASHERTNGGRPE